MLPNVKTIAVSAVAATAILAGSLAPAQAFGDRERAFLQGVATAVIVDKLITETRRPRVQVPPPVVTFVPQEPVYTHRPTHQTSLYQTPAARAFNSYSRAERVAIQRRLAHMGYYRSGIDGSFGPGTYNAVIAYARDAGQADRLGSTNTAFGVYDGLIY
ncbi:MAG: peptidoglycan-binding protein [Rhodobacteraceae bacterium]|nr:peptidoglycan-binding protein [Paracoccaceae bacterium]